MLKEAVLGYQLLFAPVEVPQPKMEYKPAVVQSLEGRLQSPQPAKKVELPAPDLLAPPTEEEMKKYGIKPAKQPADWKYVALDTLAGAALYGIFWKDMHDSYPFKGTNSETNMDLMGLACGAIVLGYGAWGDFQLSERFPLNTFVNAAGVLRYFVDKQAKIAIGSNIKW